MRGKTVKLPFVAEIVENALACACPAKADYAVRAAIELAAAGEGPVKGERIATAQEIPLKFLENILLDMKQAGVVRSAARPGGRLLARQARPTRSCGRGHHPRRRGTAGHRPGGARRRNWSTVARAGPLKEVWVAMRANLRAVLETVSLADIVQGSLPEARGRAHA